MVELSCVAIEDLILPRGWEAHEMRVIEIPMGVIRREQEHVLGTDVRQRLPEVIHHAWLLKRLRRQADMVMRVFAGKTF